MRVEFRDRSCAYGSLPDAPDSIAGRGKAKPLWLHRVKMWSVKSGDTPGVFHSLSHPHKRKGLVEIVGATPLRHCDSRPFWAAKRAAVSKSARFRDRWRRFAGFPSSFAGGKRRIFNPFPQGVYLPKIPRLRRLGRRSPVCRLTGGPPWGAGPPWKAVTRALPRTSSGTPPGPPRPPWAWHYRWTPAGRPRSCGPFRLSKPAALEAATTSASCSLLGGDEGHVHQGTVLLADSAGEELALVQEVIQHRGLFLVALVHGLQSAVCQQVLEDLAAAVDGPAVGSVVQGVIVRVGLVAHDRWARTGAGPPATGPPG